MIRRGKKNVLGVLVDAVDYEAAIEAVMEAARRRKPFSVTALAVHGVMEGVMDPELRHRLNNTDLVTPDGQPVRWAVNLLYRAGLEDRVYGPELTQRICRRAERDGLPVYFYGSTAAILEDLRQNLAKKFPRLNVAGMEASKFRKIKPDEREAVVARILASGAAIVFVGLGCPRQEIWCYEFRERLSTPVVAVGAAFPFLAGTVKQAPKWMGRRGLEWLYRLMMEPRRLWRRYVFLNPSYLCLLLLQAVGIVRFRDLGSRPQHDVSFG